LSCILLASTSKSRRTFIKLAHGYKVLGCSAAADCRTPQSHSLQVNVLLYVPHTNAQQLSLHQLVH
jgi:hypothetical protein